jgi:hypothetical protein
MTSDFKSKCDKTFLKSDKNIDLDAVKNFNIKFKDNKVSDNLLKYKKSKIQYESKNGFLIRHGCKEYLDFEQEERHLEDKKRVKTRKYATNISNCKTFKQNEKKYIKEYLSSLSSGIKPKIISKLTKVLKNPKDKRVKRLACYIKLLIDISNSMECRGNSLSISNIISKFDSEYKSTEQSKKSSAKFYLEYLLTNKNFNDIDLKRYRELFRNDTTFKQALENVIKFYKDCS